MQDPVCGMTVDPHKAAGTEVYNGVTYAFCSPARACKRSAVNIFAFTVFSPVLRSKRSRGPQCYRTGIKPLLASARIRDASPQELGMSLHEDARAACVGSHGAGPVVTREAGESLDPRPCADGLDCNARPNRAASVVGGFQSRESRSLKLRVVWSQVPVHRWHWLVDSEVVFSAPAGPGCVCAGRDPVRRCCPDHGSRIGTRGLPGSLRAAVAVSIQPWDAPSH